VFQDLCALRNLLVVCQSKSFHSIIGVVWAVGTECFCVFHVGFGKDVCVNGSPLVNHQPYWEQSKMANGVHENDIRAIWPQKIYNFLLNYFVVSSIGCQNLFQWPYLLDVAGCMLINWMLIWHLRLPCMCPSFLLQVLPTHSQNVHYLDLALNPFPFVLSSLDHNI
jgi:hypothetical protein